LGKFTKKWFGPYRVEYVLPNNIILLVTLTNFEPNHVLVNINKLKSYQFITLEVWNSKVQKPIYWEEPQTTYQPWRGIHEESGIDEDEDDKVAPQRLPIHDNKLVCKTTNKFDELKNQLT
jgi:hypothetical protein